LNGDYMAKFSFGLRTTLMIIGFGLLNFLMLFSVNWEKLPTITLFGFNVSVIVIDFILIAINVIAYSSIDIAILGK